MQKGKKLLVVVVLIMVFVLLHLFIKNGEITGNSVFLAPVVDPCFNGTIAAQWDVIFKEPSSEIKIYSPDDGESCSVFTAYKNKSTELLYIQQFKLQVFFSMSNVILAYRGNFSKEYMDVFVKNFPGFQSGPEVIDSDISGGENKAYSSLISREVTSDSVANSLFSNVFDVPLMGLSRAISQNGTIYMFSNSTNNTVSSISNYLMVDANKSLEIFVYMNLSQLSCSPSWRQMNSSCEISDSTPVWYFDVNLCGASLDAGHLNKTLFCDFNGNGVIGNQNEIQDINVNLSVFINGQTQIESYNFTNSTYLVEIKEGNLTRATFYHNFSFPLILKNITIEKENSSSKFGYIVVSGLNDIKNVTLNKINISSSSVCVKNSHVSNINQISSQCNSSDEVLVQCPGERYDFECSTGNDFFSVSGLTSSAVREVLPATEHTTCVQNWSCTEWGACLSEEQTRICNETNLCTQNRTRSEYRTCTVQCISNWNCTNWSACYKNSTQVRSCNDLNQCATPSNAPNITQTCQYKGNVNRMKIAFFVIMFFLFVVIAVILYFILKYLKEPEEELSSAHELSPYNY